MNTTNRFDFSDVPVVDAHVHVPLKWREEDNILGLGERDYVRVSNQVCSELSSKKTRIETLKTIREYSRSRPSAVSILHYYEKTYGLTLSNREDIDKFIRASIRKTGPSKYVSDVFDREKIRWVLSDQTYYPDLNRQKLDAYPRSSTRWTFPLANLIQPTWASDKKLETLEEIIAIVSEHLRVAKKNGCSGFKSIQGYFREFFLEDVSIGDAQQAYSLLRNRKPDSYISSPAKVPVYRSAETKRALKVYQDFLLKSTFSLAGKLGIPVLIHVAVGEVPKLKPWNNDPVQLYSILDNEEVRRNSTQFVLLHAGYPAHHIVSSIVTQYPNVYVDLSWISHASLLTQTILSEFLSIAPFQKVLHGSDGNHPDVIAFAAQRVRSSLSSLANWLVEFESWSETEVISLAEAVLYKNAESVFRK